MSVAQLKAKFGGAQLAAREKRGLDRSWSSQSPGSSARGGFEPGSPAQQQQPLPARNTDGGLRAADVEQDHGGGGGGDDGRGDDDGGQAAELRRIARAEEAVREIEQLVGQIDEIDAVLGSSPAPSSSCPGDASPAAALALAAVARSPEELLGGVGGEKWQGPERTASDRELLSMVSPTGAFSDDSSSTFSDAPAAAAQSSEQAPRPTSPPPPSPPSPPPPLPASRLERPDAEQLEQAEVSPARPGRGAPVPDATGSPRVVAAAAAALETMSWLKAENAALHAEVAVLQGQLVAAKAGANRWRRKWAVLAEAFVNPDDEGYDSDGAAGDSRGLFGPVAASAAASGGLAAAETATAAAAKPFDPFDLAAAAAAATALAEAAGGNANGSGSDDGSLGGDGAAAAAAVAAAAAAAETAAVGGGGDDGDSPSAASVPGEEVAAALTGSGQAHEDGGDVGAGETFGGFGGSDAEGAGDTEAPSEAEDPWEDYSKALREQEQTAEQAVTTEVASQAAAEQAAVLALALAHEQEAAERQQQELDRQHEVRQTASMSMSMIMIGCEAVPVGILHRSFHQSRACLSAAVKLTGLSRRRCICAVALWNATGVIAAGDGRATGVRA
eukprot:SAG22_NODE_1956_length_3259_cov_1.297468_1_plen_615_part_00